MQKQVGKIGTIRRDITGKACTYCGSHSYQLRLTPAPTPGTVALHAHCRQCSRPQQLGKKLGSIVWM